MSILHTGITPAYAGKTNQQFLQHTHIEDHPRVCGENRTSTLSEPATAGSPPRMRGKLHPCHKQRRLAGITPAYAGKTRFRPLTVARDRDHPRVCGENCCSPCNVGSQKGSPPRMRGKHLGHDCNQAERGITPAYAGKTIFGSRQAAAE